jgi:hypothetical protein
MAYPTPRRQGTDALAQKNFPSRAALFEVGDMVVEHQQTPLLA